MTAGRLAIAVFAGCTFAAAGCSEDPGLPTSPTSAPVTFTYSTMVRPNGWAARSFVTRVPGAIAVTLNSVAPAVRVGFGVGIPRADGGGCNLTVSMESTGADEPHLTLPADVGTYCVKVFDTGQVADEALLSITVTHP